MCQVIMSSYFVFCYDVIVDLVSFRFIHFVSKDEWERYVIVFSMFAKIHLSTSKLTNPFYIRILFLVGRRAQ